MLTETKSDYSGRLDLCQYERHSLRNWAGEQRDFDQEGRVPQLRLQFVLVKVELDTNVVFPRRIIQIQYRYNKRNIHNEKNTT